MAKKFCPNHPQYKLFGDGVCIICYRQKHAKPLKRTPLNKISAKQKNMLTVYRMLRKEKLRETPQCEIGAEGCTVVATEIHHSGKKFSHRLWLDKSKFISTCHHCHRIVEDSPKLAKELGIYNFNPKNEKINIVAGTPDYEFLELLTETENNLEEGNI